MLTKRALEVLVIMKSELEAERYEEAEVVVDGLSCWLGDIQISHGTVRNLVEHCCISLVGGFDERPKHFQINGTGKAAAIKPDVAERVRLAVKQGFAVDHVGNPLTTNPTSNC